MPCPVCGNDVWADRPHECPPGFLTNAPTTRRILNFQSLNQCCRSWLLLGWPDNDPRSGVMTIPCQRCGGDLHFDLDHPGAVTWWDEKRRGRMDPPTVVAGRIDHPLSG